MPEGTVDDDSDQDGGMPEDKSDSPDSPDEEDEDDEDE